MNKGTEKLLNEADEALKIAGVLQESSPEPLSEAVEITTSTTKETERAWPDVTYNGEPVFGPYMKILRDIEKRLDGESYDGGSGQEAFLGYSEDRDEFVSGWDWSSGWDSEMGIGWARLKLRNGRFRIIDVGVEEEPLYSGGGLNKKFWKRFKLSHGLRYD